MATIDIIIPVYNQSGRLMQCLQSLEDQTLQDFRIFIIDDGSNDGLGVKLNVWLRAQNLRATSFRNEISTKTKYYKISHQGASAARNYGGAMADAEFILFCDADIKLHKTFLKKNIDILKKNSKISYSYTSFKYGWKKFKLWEFNPEILRKMPYIHTTSVLRRECFPGFDANLKRLQDWDLWLTMLERGHIGVWIPEYLFVVRPGGTISKWVPKFFVKYIKKDPRVKSYLEAVTVVQRKHHLV